MSETKGSTISRIRKLVKGDKMDALLTNRFLYSMALKFAKVYIKRADDQVKLGRYQNIFETLPGVELIEVSKIEADCINISTCCTFKRTKDPLPPLLDGAYGSLIRSITSIDGSFEVHQTYAKTYSEMTKSSTFKYNKNKYYWLKNGYGYFPNLEWDVVDIEGMWEDAIDMYKCCADNCCVNRLAERTNIPDYIFAEIESNVRQELLNLYQVPSDNKIDNQSLLK